MISIKEQTIQAIRRMEKACDQLPWENKQAYATWLAQTYYYVRNATRVLAKAAYRCSHEDEAFHRHLITGINEEKGHEAFCVEDMAKIGCKLEDYPEYPETSAYYQTLFHNIDAHGPYALLGYFVTLEGLGAIGSDGLYERIMNSHGLEAAKFVKVHAKIDSKHFQEGIEQLEALDKRNEKIVRDAIELSAHLYSALVLRVANDFASTKSYKKAA